MFTIPEIFPGITQLSKRFNGLLLDAYGVFWGGNAFGPFPGSKEVMKKLVSEGKIIGILSNATQLAAKEIAKLHQSGLIQGEHFHFFMTSGEVAKEIFSLKKLPFETPRNKFLLFCGGHPKYSHHEALFKESIYTETSDIAEADFIYISTPHIGGEDQTDPKLFLHELEKLQQKNLPLICPNPDQFAHEGNPPRAVVRQGTIALMYEAMGGQVFYIGKPHDMSYRAAMDHFLKYNIVNPSDILMVGDTPETDIRGARSFGMPSALVTRTGIMADRIAHHGLEKVLRRLLPQDLPNYYIERLIDDV